MENRPGLLVRKSERKVHISHDIKNNRKKAVKKSGVLTIAYYNLECLVCVYMFTKIFILNIHKQHAHEKRGSSILEVVASLKIIGLK